MTDVIHELAATLEQKREEITAWMAKKRAEVPIPIYGSVDIRHGGRCCFVDRTRVVHAGGAPLSLVATALDKRRESERAMYYNVEQEATAGNLSPEEALRWDVLPWTAG